MDVVKWYSSLRFNPDIANKKLKNFILKGGMP
jgi:hypothetical protein